MLRLRVNQLSAAEIRHFRSKCLDLVAATRPDLLPLAATLLDRLDTVHWALEWHLPRWLGDHLRVDRTASDDLVLANVLGLASLRLLDDLRDGEVTPPAQADAADLAGELYAMALAVYRRRFGTGSALWPEIERRMREWHLSASDDARLASRGAPLKICAFAVCELADQRPLYPRMAVCLDETLTAMVLYDGAIDWPEDLAAGRWNAFIELAFGTSGTTNTTRPTRAAVLAAMLATDAIERHFALVHAAFERARAIAAELGLDELADFLHSRMVDIDGQAATMSAHYAALGERASAAVFADR